MRQKPTVLAREIVASSRLFRVEELQLRFSNGVERTYERLVGKGVGYGAVMVVAMLDAEHVDRHARRVLDDAHHRAAHRHLEACDFLRRDVETRVQRDHVDRPGRCLLRLGQPRRRALRLLRAVRLRADC